MITIQIDNTSPEAQRLLKYLNTVPFITIPENKNAKQMEFVPNQETPEAIEDLKSGEK